MYKDIKMPSVAVSGIILALLFTSIILYTFKEAEKEKRVGVQKQLNETLLAKQDVEAKLRDVEIENSDIRANLKVQEEKAVALAGDLALEKAAGAKHAAAMQEKGAQLAVLQAKLDESNAERKKLEKDIEALNAESLDLRVQLMSIVKSREEMERRAKELTEKEGISLGTIMINQKAK